MDKKRTLHRLRDYKNSILIFLFLGGVGFAIIFAVGLFDDVITAYLKERANLVLETKYANNINYAIEMCERAYEMIEKAAFFAILISFQGFIMVMFFLRIGVPSKYKQIALAFMGIGGLAISLFYILVAFALPSNAIVVDTFQEFSFIRIVGVIMVVSSYIIFTLQLFKTIILENE
jgi:hypothetical protein